MRRTGLLLPGTTALCFRPPLALASGLGLRSGAVLALGGSSTLPPSNPRNLARSILPVLSLFDETFSIRLSAALPGVATMTSGAKGKAAGWWRAGWRPREQAGRRGAAPRQWRARQHLAPWTAGAGAVTARTHLTCWLERVLGDDVPNLASCSRLWGVGATGREKRGGACHRRAKRTHLTVPSIKPPCMCPIFETTGGCTRALPFDDIWPSTRTI
jgi:hypothetical protein